ncbi:MAG: PEP/pyruvate-binding domain-containing protein [Nitrospiraceae bacterium]
MTTKLASWTVKSGAQARDRSGDAGDPSLCPTDESRLPIKRSVISSRLVVPLESCSDPVLAGGKAAGLARLMETGFRIPPGLCVTTQLYRDTLQAGGLNSLDRWNRVRRAPEAKRESLLADCRRTVASLVLPQAVLESIDTALAKLEKEFATENGTTGGMLWAVRSSASDEDATDATFGGIYRTVLGVSRGSIAAAILDCWASQWTTIAFTYRERALKPRPAPAMAVILQPLLAPRAAGVAYSRHPLSGRADQIMINAVFGLAEPLVSGSVRPDQYVVEIGSDPASLKLIHRDIAEKTKVRVAMPWGLTDQPLSERDQKRSVLEEREVIALARLVKEVECVVGKPVDVEWADDTQGLWLLQARPIPEREALPDSTAIVWSRANFKETLPELPSPLGLSLLDGFMETHIVRCYRELGCRIPPGVSSVKVIRGRPFINMTLFQSVMAQLGGDSTLLAEQMGGETSPLPFTVPQLPWWRIAILMEWTIRRAAKRAPKWFQEMRRLGERCDDELARGLMPLDLSAWEKELNYHILTNGDLTFAIFNGVSQGLYVMKLLLERRLGAAWRPLLNQALQGVGTIISAQPILQLTELAEAARREPVVQSFLLAEPWMPESFRTELTGTRFLQAFEAYLAEYGHRAIGESDIMSPRFTEVPEYVLGVIRGHVLFPSSRPADEIRRGQESSRQEALRQLRARFGWRWHEWAVFTWWHRRLCHYLELREANRHALMHFIACARHVATSAGGTLATRGILQSRDDIFFLRLDEIKAVAPGTAGDLQGIVAARRAEMEIYASQIVPDTVMGNSEELVEECCISDGSLRGLPISTGYAEGPVCLLLSPNDMKRVKRGDILVASVIDPGMAPLMGLVAGLVVEMGGMLSHGAIIAREYGLPAIANVHGVTCLLKDGERVAVDATAGVIKRFA